MSCEHDSDTARSRRTVPLPDFVRLVLIEHRDRELMEIVGHSAIEMTMNVYAHVSLDMQRDALGRLTDRLDL